ncbi:hypothetical protein HPB50_007732 [Hyalomma asiaticum]|uniref:Uncharacterized protein n=1 Tax=Hyalomma asiaticum TaxID=266040 RepID=A0ACB7RZE5_HYAAI|nr:hypothetical protein HPB50_007732 [Hyalomma asiaticum]
MHSQVSALTTVPCTASSLLECSERTSFDLSNLRYVATGGSCISEDVARRLFQELRLQNYVQSYGQSEMLFISGGVHAEAPRFRSIGRLRMGLEAMDLLSRAVRTLRWNAPLVDVE